jgi:D-alanyl-D-alanine carboxypeptidase/D-alanyl-D-alanine-endopeptidase (penicillin-binding protein 4)
LGCGEREQNLSVMPHTRYVGALFSAIWKELGGSLQGKERDGLVGNTAKLFSTHRSDPLSLIIRDINKYSNNVMARQLFLTLGEALPDPMVEQATSGNQLLPNVAAIQSVFPAKSDRAGRMTIPRSILSMQTWLARNDLAFHEVVLENGAGLSRKERISTAHMAQLLQHAYDHPLSAELQASLPILGVDGSVKRRLRDSSAASHAHLKTGTLEGVKAIAGYVHSQTGREWIVVFYINHYNAKHGQDAQDALIEWLAHQ